ncbi:MAG: hypothetical protein AB7O97_10000 [Planctomycetota bacterium]
MTDKGYDPFSYGQVPIASGGAKTDAMAESPEDMLFQSSAPARAGGADSDWDPPPSFQGGGATEFDFGADILGEQGRRPGTAAAAASAGAGSAPARTLPSTPKPRPATALPERQASPQSVPSRGGQAGAAPRQVRPQATRPARRPQQDQPIVTPILPAPKTGPLAMLMPAFVLAGGEGAAMWLHFGMHNTVMAGLAAALGLALAGVTWFALRR